MGKKNVRKDQLTLSQELSPKQLSKLIRKSEEHSRQIAATRFTYPDPDEYMRQLETGDTDKPSFGAGISTEDQPLFEAFASRRRKKGKKTKQGKGGGGSKPLPNPQVVATEVAKYFAGVPVAGSAGPVQVAEFNGEFLDASKAKFFAAAYQEIFNHFHIALMVEVDSGGLQQIAQQISYTSYCSTANTRSQAVGFLVHPRLNVLGVHEYPQVGNVQGIPDLRPLYVLELEDSVTGETFDMGVVHLKSMRGGQKVTSVVRRRQCDIIQNVLGSGFKGIVGGDWNFFVSDPNVTDGEPLVLNGFSLVAPNDQRGTHSMGGRIDAFYAKNMTLKIALYDVRDFFRNPNVTRAFSDHACTSIELRQKAGGSGGGNVSSGTKVDSTPAPDAPAPTGDNKNTDVSPASETARSKYKKGRPQR